MRNKIFFSIIFFLFFNDTLNAQCAMCKAVVEANLKEGGSAGAGLNEGILYLMAMPYVAILIFGLFYFIQKKSQKQSI
jgi:hypothetical protein|tara:strand:+ start:299 stop:532 length:234 start_codon:yes stop_codon:yes gene_type:complete